MLTIIDVARLVGARNRYVMFLTDAQQLLHLVVHSLVCPLQCDQPGMYRFKPFLSKKTKPYTRMPCPWGGVIL